MKKNCRKSRNSKAALNAHQPSLFRSHSSGGWSRIIRHQEILGHSNLATTERYMGSFDTSKTDETLRNVFAKKQSSSKGTEEPTTSKEEQAIELLKGMTPEQIMAVISAINK